MPIDVTKLLAFDIPSVRQHVAPRDAAFYALSVGFGQDPLDLRQLDFVDPDTALKVVPTMALVTAHPGFWMAEEGSGIDPSAVLHADQSIERLGALPIDGVVTSDTKIVGLVDKGAGKAALVRTETMIRDAAGTDVARLRRTIFIRNGGGFGGENEAPQPLSPPPDREADHVVEFPIRPEQALYYRLNGDMNPLHSDPRSARQAGFDRPILHGLCTFGFACHAALRTLARYDVSRLKALSGRFSGVVFPGETLRVELWNSGEFLARVTERNMIVLEDGRAMLDRAEEN